MRFLVAPTPRALDAARLPVRAFLVCTVLLMAAATGQRWAQHGMSTEGQETLFADAQTPGGALGSATIWEGVHTSAFLDGFLLLVLGSLLAICPVRLALRRAFVAGGLAAALADMLLPFMAFRVPGWATMRIAAFVALQAFLLVATAVVWATFGRRGPGDA